MAQKKASSVAQPDREYVEALARGIRVLETFDELNAERNLTDVVKITGYTPATARRSLHTLVKLGYLSETNKRYSLTPRVLNLGAAYINSVSEQEILGYEVKRLVSLFGGSSGIAILVKGEALCIAHDYIPGSGARPAMSVGTRVPAYPTAIGCALLSGLSDIDLSTYLSTVELKSLTSATETRKTKIRSFVRDVAQRGYATVMDQLYFGVTSLAVPITSPSGKIVGAISSTAFAGALTSEQIVEQRLRELQKSAERLRQMMRQFPALMAMFEKTDLG